MEYRGYDSVGVATKDDAIHLRKGTGNVNDVNSRLNLDVLPGKIGIGHTRWATHGKVTDTNAHPHASNSSKIALVHNGKIDNFEQLRDELIQDGYTFESETDTEVIVNLLQRNYTGDIKAALTATVDRLEGEYAFVAMFEDGQLAAARLHAPLVIGLAKDAVFLSSDVLGFIEHTDNVIYIENRNFVIINDDIEILDFDGNKVDHAVTKISKEFGDAYKDDYAHFTLKEIYEQPDTVIRAVNHDTAITAALPHITSAKNIYITGSGSSYNASLVAKQVFAKYAKIRVETIMSSEVQFAVEMIEPDSVLVAISQSGESADVLEAVRIAKENNCKIISIVNVLTSSLARESDIVIAMNCGPEIGVAATKSFTSQLAILYTIAQEISDSLILDTKQISQNISKTLDAPDNIKEIAGHLKHISDIYVLGRGIHYPIAIEAALKLKEITYIHAEGIPGGELKHGPLALIDENVFVIVINPNDTTYNDTATSTREIKARGAKIIGISDVYSDMYDYWIEIPNSEYTICEIVPLQLLSYYIALEKDADPDYPRNLAKSVTVK